MTQTEKVELEMSAAIDVAGLSKTAATGLQWVSLEMNGKRWVFLRHVHAHFQGRDGKHQCRMF